jgi:Mrp family chromosome partitioning ATPase
MSLSNNMQLATERRKQMPGQMQKMKARMSKIKHKIAVIRRKDGVGKSKTTANLAAAFAMHGNAAHVGVLDAAYIVQA